MLGKDFGDLPGIIFVEHFFCYFTGLISSNSMCFLDLLVAEFCGAGYN